MMIVALNKGSSSMAVACYNL